MFIVTLYNGETITLGTLELAKQWAIRYTMDCHSDEENTALKSITDEAGVIYWEDKGENSIIQLFKTTKLSLKELAQYKKIANAESPKKPFKERLTKVAGKFLKR